MHAVTIILSNTVLLEFELQINHNTHYFLRLGIGVTLHCQWRTGTSQHTTCILTWKPISGSFESKRPNPWNRSPNPWNQCPDPFENNLFQVLEKKFPNPL